MFPSFYCGVRLVGICVKFFLPITLNSFPKKTIFATLSNRILYCLVKPGAFSTISKVLINSIYKIDKHNLQTCSFTEIFCINYYGLFEYRIPLTSAPGTYQILKLSDAALIRRRRLFQS